MIENVTNNTFLAGAMGAGFIPRGTTLQPSQRVAPRPQVDQSNRNAHPQPVDSLELSVEAQELVVGRREGSNTTEAGDKHKHIANAALSSVNPRDQDAPTGRTSGASSELTAEQQQQVRKLKKNDQEVRRHEQAHAASAGPHARGGPSFEFETGPDGKQYAVGGEVQIDTSPVKNDPRATIAKMQQVRRAALAPANPSSQDRAVAASAAAEEQKARAELTEQQQEAQSADGHAPAVGDAPAASESHSTTPFTINPTGSVTQESGHELVGILMDLTV